MTSIVLLEPLILQLSTQVSNISRVSETVGATSEQVHLLSDLCQIVLRRVHSAVRLQVSNCSVVVRLELTVAHHLLPVFQVHQTRASRVVSDHHIHTSVVVEFRISIRNGSKE